MDQTLDIQTRDAVRGAALAQARDAVRAFALTHGYLDGHLCGCGRPSCLNDHHATMSLVTMLRAVSTGWTSAGPNPAGEALLRERLLAFARAFGLDECPNGDPECHCARIGDGDAREVLRTVADAWHGRAGNVAPEGLAAGEGPALTLEGVAALADYHAYHRAVLDALALRLDPEQADSFRAVVSRVRENPGGAWREEARAMAAEALASWVPRPGDIPEVHRVLDSALALAFHAEWTTGDAADFETAAADACGAILVRGFAHPSVTEILFAPFAGVVSLEDLDAFAEAELLAEGVGA